MATLDTHAIARTLTDANRTPPSTATMPPARVRVNTREEFDDAFKGACSRPADRSRPRRSMRSKSGASTSRTTPAGASLRRLASPERMMLQPADPVLFAVVSTALAGGVLRREAM